MTKFHNIALTAITAAFLAGGASQSFAEERVCRGALGAVTVDNVLVPMNATCSMDETKVKGSIVVKQGASLIATRTVVIGNVQAERAKRVTLRGASRIGGSVQVELGGGATVINSTVDGSIQLISNGSSLRVVNVTVGADVQVFQNTGGAEIRDNRIDGNLQCKANQPTPTGGGNLVGGNKEDQCRGL